MLQRKDAEKERRRKHKWNVVGPAVAFGSAVVCTGLLLTSFDTVKAAAASSDAVVQESAGSSVNIELGGDFYRALFGRPESEVKAEARAEAEAEFKNERESLFTEEDGKLYVNYDGRKLQVVDTEDGLHVIEEDGTEEGIGEAIAGVGNPKIMTDENGNRYYHIVWGDTLCKISSDVHYSVDELAEYNHIRNVHLIYAESDLRIPD